MNRQREVAGAFDAFAKRARELEPCIGKDVVFSKSGERCKLISLQYSYAEVEKLDGSRAMVFLIAVRPA